MSVTEQPAAMLSQARKMNGIMFYIFDASFVTMNECAKFLMWTQNPQQSLKIKWGKTFWSFAKLWYNFVKVRKEKFYNDNFIFIFIEENDLSFHHILRVGITQVLFDMILINDV